jgi:hypothetical protein
MDLSRTQVAEIAVALTVRSKMRRTPRQPKRQVELERRRLGTELHRDARQAAGV